MILAIAAILVGLVVLVYSASLFINGSVSTAKIYGVSPLIIGMLIIGFGTSAPELAVSTISAFSGNPEIALGNAYGSNISNIALILGLTALIYPVRSKSQFIRKEIPILLVITSIAAWQAFDGVISRYDSIILILLFIGFVFLAIRDMSLNDKIPEEELTDANANISKSRSVLFVFIGLILLILSSRLLVWGAVEVASQFGVSDLVIGLTVVAIGTSLPELASCLIAAYKRQHDMVLGNILGSNIFNALIVVGVAGSIEPMQIGSNLIYRDIFGMFLVTSMLLVFCFKFRGKSQISRIEGLMFLMVYVLYISYLLFG